MFPQQNTGEKTRDIVAKQVGFGSGKTFEKAKFISKSATPEVKAKIDSIKFDSYFSSKGLLYNSKRKSWKPLIY